MSRKTPSNLRRTAAKRAEFRCEYCHIPSVDSFYGFQTDHIISRKHGGATTLDNLAFACPDCNRNKGTDLGTYLKNSDEFVRFFNPRADKWSAHFEILPSGEIIGKTDIGTATIKIFQMNHPDRIIERALLWKLGFLP